MDFEVLRQRVTPKLHAIAKKLDGRFTFLDDDDLYQQAMVHLWQMYKNHELSDKTDSYILQGCLFFLKNYIRTVYKKTDEYAVSIDDLMEQEGSTAEKVLAIDDKGKHVRSIEYGFLRDEIESHLSKRERKIFSLYLEGFSTREIGKRFGISHPMVIRIEKRIFDKCRKLTREVFLN